MITRLLRFPTLSGLAFDGFAAEAFTFGGFAVGGDQLKSTPRGVPADHQRAELMRHRSLTASRDWPIGPALETRDAFGLIQQTWRQLAPLCDWLGEHVGGSQAPGRY